MNIKKWFLGLDSAERIAYTWLFFLLLGFIGLCIIVPPLGAIVILTVATLFTLWSVAVVMINLRMIE